MPPVHGPGGDVLRQKLDRQRKNASLDGGRADIVSQSGCLTAHFLSRLALTPGGALKITTSLLSVQPTLRNYYYPPDTLYYYVKPRLLREWVRGPVRQESEINAILL